MVMARITWRKFINIFKWYVYICFGMERITLINELWNIYSRLIHLFSHSCAHKWQRTKLPSLIPPWYDQCLTTQSSEWLNFSDSNWSKLEIFCLSYLKLWNMYSNHITVSWFGELSFSVRLIFSSLSLSVPKLQRRVLLLFWKLFTNQYFVPSNEPTGQLYSYSLFSCTRYLVPGTRY